MMRVFRHLLTVLSLAMLAGFWAGAHPTAVVAQQAVQELDYAAWGQLAARADEAIEASRASTPALESLREELADWRQRFLNAQKANRNAIATAEAQLAALGPEPESGSETANIAEQRAELNERLAQLSAPVKTAELSFKRADGLIRGIDEIIRERQAEEVLEFGPSPVNPTHWQEGVKALGATYTAVRKELATAWDNPVQRSETREDMPAVLLLAIIGLVLVARGRRWSRRLMNRMLGENPGAGRWIAGFFASLGSLVLPMIGVIALVEAVYITGLVGLRGDQLLGVATTAVFFILLSRWLAMRIFPAREVRALHLRLNDSQRYAGRWYGAMLGLVTGIYIFLAGTAVLSDWSETANNVVLFPAMVTAALLLWGLARLLRAHSRAVVDIEGEDTYRAKMTRLLSWGLTILAIAAPALAAVGYFRLAQALMLPSLISLQLLAVLLILQRLVVEVYVLIKGNRERASESLIPVLIGFFLILLSLPIFALIWGARVADLTELWARFSEGIYVGETRISPSNFLIFAAVFIIGYLATRFVQGALKNTVLPKTRLDVGGRNAVVSGIGYVGIFLAAVIAITSAGIDLSSLAIVAGALSVGIGFGLQNIVSNFVSGIILLIERPISEGDWIEVGGNMGYVRDISVRSTRIETFDRYDVIVPNSDLVSGTVTNYTRGNTIGRVIVPVGVAYGTDSRKVEEILLEIGKAHPMVLASPEPYIVFKGFGESSMDFEIRAILRDVNWVLSVHSDMNHEIARRFAEEGIEIPFAQRDVWIRTPKGDAPVQDQIRIAEERPVSSTAHLSEGDIGDGDGGDR